METRKVKRKRNLRKLSHRKNNVSKGNKGQKISGKKGKCSKCGKWGSHTVEVCTSEESSKKLEEANLASTGNYTAKKINRLPCTHPTCNKYGKPNHTNES